ncbi:MULTISPECIES: acylneuraminate cytidylyltransferase family protein [unclassified Thermosipho (in: thermotogales)]|uniref:acylneuraminate cytidylyltransferase family protein n=1 Tax=unclassified Thermosipho (in: thermotogales) TaxID=2676525 RepID=UPI0009866658|nr:MULTISPECIES: acylneuraminate cytidylyltransferase family protein [unclassified Thermosipho (in: thermotogales)]MBT1247035.1 CMP-N-acetlyneuraminic acid synthetase [Thermosipho sp. 1244]OOC46894.1 CMP-N-acetlyneuraminic acid synthetase [Thermosipho sp. 1223]
MYNKSFLAIIPARGDSKGIKDKNIISLKNKPLISYTIEAAEKSEVFDEVMVTTDSEKIAEIARKYGANVPFLRPTELATDTANSIDVIVHTLNYYVSKNIHFDYFVLLQPTSPLRKSEDIINAIELLFEKDANSIVSVCEVEHSPLFSNILPDDLSLSNFIKEEVKNKRRQDLPKYFRVNGAIYIAKVDYFLKTKNFYGKKSYAYIMPKERSVDIDDYIDLKLAEVLLEENYENKRDK